MIPDTPSIFTRQRIIYYCSTLLIAALIIQVVAVFQGRQIGGDFAAFYAMGKVALNYPHRELYNIEVQDKEYSATIGTQGTSPFPYTPWFTIPLEVFARLPYLVAFALWTLISVSLLIIGFWLTAKAVRLPTEWIGIGIIACLAFPPFLFYTLINGQPAAFGFFVLTLGYFLKVNERPLLGGIALSLLSYKPTLVVFIGPMLLLTRQWRMLLGLALGGTILALISYWWAGPDGCKGFVALMRLFAKATSSPVEIFQTSKYINIGAALRLLLGPQPRFQFALAVLSLLLACFLWYRLGPTALSWSLAIVFGILFSMYSPIYDAVLLIFAVTLVGVTTLESWLVVTLYMVPAVTIPVAELTGIQLYTLVLIAFLSVLIKRTGWGKRV